MEWVHFVLEWVHLGFAVGPQERRRVDRRVEYAMEEYTPDLIWRKNSIWKNDAILSSNSDSCEIIRNFHEIIRKIII